MRFVLVLAVFLAVSAHGHVAPGANEGPLAHCPLATAVLSGHHCHGADKCPIFHAEDADAHDQCVDHDHEVPSAATRGSRAQPPAGDAEDPAEPSEDEQAAIEAELARLTEDEQAENDETAAAGELCPIWDYIDRDTQCEEARTALPEDAVELALDQGVKCVPLEPGSVGVVLSLVAREDHDLAVWCADDEWAEDPQYRRAWEYRIQMPARLRCLSHRSGPRTDQVRILEEGLMACAVPWEGSSGEWALKAHREQ